ncbi:esterase-like activity of phytase family protein [Lolliginicoccus suaedae]|uniref:esterase-like activity of phytase family protein n=1 Tax=Lolliginicoccus suaedae TaxID=2605429 RepID=UPI0011F0774F|nr:esterase-like activity of phytase family protein [Lolliginicoccus suaedae]
MRTRLGIATMLVTVTISAVSLAPQVAAERVTHLDTAAVEVDSRLVEAFPGGFTGLDATPIPGVFLAVSGNANHSGTARFTTIRIPLGADGRFTSSRIEVLADSPLRDAAGPIGGATFTAGAVRQAGGDVLVASTTRSRSGVVPRLSGFDITGAHVRDYALPGSWMPSDAGGSGIASAPSTLGAAIDGGLIAVASGAPLQQDRSLPGRPRARLALIDRYSGIIMREHAFELSMGDRARVTGILALSGTDYLIVEQGTGPDGQASARLHRASTKAATDIAGRRALTGEEAPLESELLLDLDTVGAQAGAVEAISLGPRLADGTATVVLATSGGTGENGVAPRIHVLRLER